MGVVGVAFGRAVGAGVAPASVIIHARDGDGAQRLRIRAGGSLDDA